MFARQAFFRGNCKANAVRSLASGSSGSPLFGGEVAELYSKIFNQLAPSWKRQVESVRQHATPLTTILDLASGPGQPAMMLAQAFPNAQVISSDVSQDMVMQAKQSVDRAGLTNVSCQVVDMQAISDVANDSIDACTVSFGYMFPPDINLALAETHRVLRPKGLVVATVWVEMPIIPLVGRIMTAVLGHKPPPPPINPLSLSKHAAFDVPLAKAGFGMLNDEQHTMRFDLGNEPDVAWRLAMLPAMATLQDLAKEGKHGDVFAAAQEAFERETATWKDPSTGCVITPDATYRLVVVEKQVTADRSMYGMLVEVVVSA